MLIGVEIEVSSGVNFKVTSYDESLLLCVIGDQLARKNRDHTLWCNHDLESQLNPLEEVQHLSPSRRTQQAGDQLPEYIAQQHLHGLP